MKKTILKSVILGAFSLVLCSSVLAQDSNHEFSFWLGGGLSSSSYKVSSVVSDKKQSMGGMVGLGYTYHLSESFGLNTGVEYSMYNSKLKINEFANNYYYATDNELENMTYSYDLRGVEEKHNLGYIQIPIMLQYTLPLGEQYAFYAAGGAKVGFAASRQYKISASEVVTKGEYKEHGVILEDVPEEGFGSYANLKTDGSLDLNVACLAALEAGMKFKLNSQLSLYTGAYFDYSLNKINSKSDAKNVYVRYDDSNPGKPLVHSIMNSVYDTDFGRARLASKMTPMAVGIKLRLGFSL